ncbi:LAETG motif-containing sortase-dependent surface protein [Streptomyces anulatus]
MTIPRRSWRGAGTLVAAAVVGLTGGVISPGPAAAHTPTWAVTCSEVTVDLTDYTSDAPDTVTATVDGKDLLPTETVGREFHKKLTLPSSPDLAETGSSSSTPVIGGAAIAVLLAGGGILWAVRKRRTAQN